MFKRFVVMLIIAIAGQLSWATVTAYCLHEQGVGAKHFGHHEHEHKTEDAKSISEKSSSTKKSAPHADCATCSHHGSLGTGDAQFPPPLNESLLSHIEGAELAPSSPYLKLPERPKWIHAA
ncbi:hypothetical protein [Duganella sp. P38]|uniref:hypothetical protein n=1 Tax=Duganella sp. P38 TaxID=3423949 RepID=UPI003D7B5376